LDSIQFNSIQKNRNELTMYSTVGYYSRLKSEDSTVYSTVEIERDGHTKTIGKQ
jgi:hypothetical protein